MNLGTHIFFAGVVTAVYTGNPYYALLAGIGSFIPDLDREYIFVSPKPFGKKSSTGPYFTTFFSYQLYSS